MQAVPSLAGTGTAVAAAVAGLVFAQSTDEPTYHLPTSSRPHSTATLDRSSSLSRPIPTSRHAAKPISYAVFTEDGQFSYHSREGSSSRQFSPLTPPPAASSTISSASATLSRSSATTTQSTATNGSSRRHSLTHRGDCVPPSISEVSRDSVSSNGSWIRRLSLRPHSLHGSPRSSIAPDSPSLDFSLGSAAPMLSPGAGTATAARPPTQPRNKLVKRTIAVQDGHARTGSLSRGSRPQLPTLRRPATSHQRSATLQQSPLVSDSSVFVPPISAAHQKSSLDQVSCAGPTTRTLSVDGAATPEPSDLDGLDHDLAHLPPTRGSSSARWKSFFHERLTRTSSTHRGGLSSAHEGGPGGPGHHRHTFPSRSIQTQRKNIVRVFLTDVATILPMHQKTTPAIVRDMEGQEETSSQDAASRRTKRSLSVHFGSPGTWISRASSLRRPKRASGHSVKSIIITPSSHHNHSANLPDDDSRRHASTPLPVSPLQSQLQSHLHLRSATVPTNYLFHAAADGPAAVAQPSRAAKRDQGLVASRSSSSPIPPHTSDGRPFVYGRQRNYSSPLPPVTRLSSLSIDIARLGSSVNSPEALAVAAAAAQHNKEDRYPGSGVACAYTTLPRAFPLVPRSRDVSYDRPSTVGGSDFELRGFLSSGEDDDTDFKSDTIFDSLRTFGSAHIRASDTPIESMFDESPPSTAGNGKTKRLSIQEILGQTWDGETKIVEEDEGISTPMHTATRKSPSPILSSACYDFGASNHLDGMNIIIPPSRLARVDPGLSFVQRMSFSRLLLNDDGDEEDEDDNGDDDEEIENWACIDDDGVTNNLSPPASQTNSLRGMNEIYGTSGNRAFSNQRSALVLISGNGKPENDTLQPMNGLADENDRPRSNLFDWSESAVHPDKSDADGHVLRPNTVHGKQEMDLRGSRVSNRKGPILTHVRSQSVPAIGDLLDGTKPPAAKFGTWASGPKNVSEDWDDDFDFETSGSSDSASGTDDALDALGNGQDTHGTHGTHGHTHHRSGKGSSASFSMVVPASIQATQPTVRAHSGQIRELSLLVDGLKRLCRHARDLDIVGEAPTLWKEAENIIALASPDEDVQETAPAASTTTVEAETDDAEDSDDDEWSRRTSTELQFSDAEEQLADDGFDADTMNSADDNDSFGSAITLPQHDRSKTAVVRERQNVRRRSVFSPEDDIFGGGWPLPDDKPVGVTVQHQEDKQEKRAAVSSRTPRTPMKPDSTMIESIMEAMQQQRSASAPIRRTPAKRKSTELFFNTNTLQELVKRANTLFHSLSDLVRRAELLTQSPSCTPKNDRHYRREDGSPAFTRVFSDPATTPRRLPQSPSGSSMLSRASPPKDSPKSKGINQRLQMMTVN